MRRSGRAVLFGMLAALAAASAAWAGPVARIDVPAGRLAVALTTLARQAGVEILFSEALVGDRAAGPVRGQVEVGAALDRLLAGSGLRFQRTADGIFVVTAAVVLPPPPPVADEAVPEILVLGRRAQNGDIRRTQDDVQPYQVYDRRDLQRAHSSTLDDFARSRLPANAQIASAAQTGSDTRSEINLRGLGANQTLILLDGRRLPNLPNPPFSFNQPDINGIPVEMIDRIEVLTATAGGVYGTGATSGAVNIVLRRDYRGAEVSATTGISTRGDAFEYRLFGRIGFTPDHGRTDVMVAVGRTREATLHAGARDYLARAQQRRFANDPNGVLAASPFPIGNGINIIGVGPLTLDPQFGGAALGANFTTLPLGLGPDVAARNALLIANAGKLNLDRPPGIDGDTSSVAGSPTVRSIFVNVRHDFGGGVEAVLDLVDTRNSGRRRSSSYTTSGYPIAANQPNNPFQQTIYLAIPVEEFGGADSRTVDEMQRYTAGLTVPLPGRWRANAEIGGGRATARNTIVEASPSSDLYNALIRGITAPGRPALDPLGDWNQFRAALAAYAVTGTSTGDQSDDFRNLTLRLAGPVVALPGGSATLTLLAEERRETVAASKDVFNFGDVPLTLQLPRVAQRVRSLYGEARLPVTPDGGPLGNLEFQLALRQDWTRVSLPGAVTFFATDPPPFAKSNRTTMYTAGARVTPLPGVMLRGSTATGALPPATSQIGTRLATGSDATPDPQRGGRLLGSETPASFVTGGRADLRPERARSLSAGAILTPYGNAGPRLSIDFTRITKHDEIVPLLGGSEALLLADEASYPGRVTRAPLSDADRALGFTGGPVTRIDLSSINLARTRIDSLDLALDDHLDAGDAGAFDAYLRATWEPTFRQRASASARAIERVGYSDGPLEWRGNAGLDWSRGRVTLGCNGQFYSRYRVTYALGRAASAAQLILDQGARHIPAQFYLDLSGSYRFGSARPGAGPELRWGLLNLFDHRPPTVVVPGTAGYSYYGDPRRRRVQVTLDVPIG